MFSTLRTRFGIPGVISVMALVFAMLGGAYAASNSSGGGKATASAKAKKGPRGPKGATGPAGPQGPAGPEGPAGANGKDGANGTNGSNGGSGAPGQGVKTEIEPPEGACGDQEGVKLTSASGVDYVCNGVDGTQGVDGDPWTAGGTLPAQATETGTWAFTASPPTDGDHETFPAGTYAYPISLPIPTATPPTPHYVTASPPPECENTDHPGEASASNPEADSGHLCVYTGPLITSGRVSLLAFGSPSNPAAQADTAGTLALFTITGTKAVIGEGTWAVTG